MDGDQVKAFPDTTPWQVGDSGIDWSIGRLRGATTQSTADKNYSGEIDEFLITTHARYTGATYTVPDAPYDNSAVANLFVADSDGNETQLT